MNTRLNTRHGSAEVTLPSDREILITRRFDAPQSAVWRALTEPQHLLRWWGPRWCPMVSCEVDLRDGGSWRYVCRGDDGVELGWHGEYREIDAGSTDRHHRGLRGVPRRGVVEHDDARGGRRRDHAAHAGAALLAGESRRAPPVGHGGRHAGDVRPARRAPRGPPVAPPSGSAVWPSGSAGAWTACVPTSGTFPPRATGGRRATSSDTSSAGCRGSSAAPAWRSPQDRPPRPTRPRHGTTSPASCSACSTTRRVASKELDFGPPGRMTTENAIGMVVTGDIVVHTWDLARATGQDETLDPVEVSAMYEGMQAIDEMLRSSGHYGPEGAGARRRRRADEAHRVHRPHALNCGAEYSPADEATLWWNRGSSNMDEIIVGVDESDTATRRSAGGRSSWPSRPVASRCTS